MPREMGNRIGPACCSTKWPAVAQPPYFAFGPNVWLRLAERARDTNPPTPARDWRNATVDVVVPAFDGPENILRCLGSLQRQTRRPRRIVVVDDGTWHDTAALARRFGDLHGLNLLVITRLDSIGRMTSIKDQTRTLDSDVLFVLDSDTILESDNYIERTVHDLYQGVGVASACGRVLPLRGKNRLGGLYLFLQRFGVQTPTAICGTTSSMPGCAVAYRRAYLEALFDASEPRLADHLANADEVGIELALTTKGYRIIEVTDVCARSVRRSKTFRGALMTF